MDVKGEVLLQLFYKGE